MQEGKKLFRGSVFMMVANVITSLSSLVIILMIAHYLGVENLGIYTFGISLVGLFIMFSDFGMFSYITREIAKDKKNKSLLGVVITTKIILLVVCAIVASLFAAFTEESGLVKTIVVLFAVSYVLINICYIYETILRAYEYIGILSFLFSLERVLFFILAGIAILLGLGLISVIWMLLLNNLILMIISRGIVNKKIGKIGLEFDLKKGFLIIKKSVPFFIASVFFVLFLKLSVVVLSYFVSYEEVGIYSAANRLLWGLVTIPTMVMVALFPAMSRYNSESREKLNMAFRMSFKYLLIISLPLAVGGVLIPEKIIYLLYPLSYFEAIPVLQMLSLSIVFLFLNYLMLFLMNAIGLEKKGSKISLELIVVSFFLMIAFSKWMGAYGAAFALTLSQMIIFVVLMTIVYFEGFSLNFFENVNKPVFSGVVMGLFLVIVRDFNIFMIIVSGALVYILMLLLTKAVGKNELRLLKGMVIKDGKER